MNRGKEKHFFVLSAILIFILIYIPSFHVPFHSDDYKFYLMGTSFDALYNHYMNWEGRLISDYTASLLLNLFSRPIYMGINASAFLLTLICISVIPSVIKGDVSLINYKNCVILWLSFFIYWICNPCLGQTSFWLVGSAVYLWSIMWAGLYLACLFGILGSENSFLRVNRRLLLCTLGFFAGLSNEATGASIVFLTFILILLCKLCKDKDCANNTKVLVAGFFSSFFGFLVLILAPGNYVRLNTVFSDWKSLSVISKVIVHFFVCMPYAISQFSLAFLIISILITALTWRMKEKREKFYFLSLAFVVIVVLQEVVLPMAMAFRFELTVVILFSLFTIIAIIISSFCSQFRSGIKCVINNRTLAGLFFVAAVFSILVFIFSPSFAPRVINTCNYFIVLTIANLTYAVLTLNDSVGKSSSFFFRWQRRIVGLLMLICVPFFIFSWIRFTYAMVQTNTQKNIWDEIILQTKIKGCNQVEVPDWYFTKLAKYNDTFDLCKFGETNKYYGIERITWKPVYFNYAVLKSKEPLIRHYKLNNDLYALMYLNDCQSFLDDPCLVFGFEDSLELFLNRNAKMLFRFYEKGNPSFVEIEKNIDDYIKIGNNYYCAIKFGDIHLQTIDMIDIVFNGAINRIYSGPLQVDF